MTYLKSYFDVFVSYSYPFVIHLYCLKSTVKETQGINVETGDHIEFMVMSHFLVTKI